MSTIESVELKLADKKIEELEREIDDYREFIKSTRNCFSDPSFSKKHDLKVMCDFLILRYMDNEI